MIAVSCYILLGLIALLWLFSWWRPGLLVGVLITQFASEQVLQSSITLLSNQQSLFNVGLGMAAIASICVQAIRRKLFLGFGNANKYLVAIISWSLLTTLWTPDQRHATELIITFVPYLTLMALTTPHLVNCREDLNAALYSTVLVAIPTCLIALMAEWGGRSIVIGDEQTGNPLALASTAIAMSIVSVAMLVAKARMRAVYGLILIIAVGAGFYTCFQTGSRGQFWIGAAVVGGLIISSFRKIGLQTIGLSIILVLGLIVADIDIAASFSGRWSYDASIGSVQVERVETLIAPIWNEWSRRGATPQLVGLGLASCYYYAGTYPHFVLLEILFEQGLVGLLLVMISLIVFGSDYLREQAREGIRRDVANFDWAHRAYIALLIFFGLLSFKQGSFLGSFDLYAILLILTRWTYLSSREHSMDRRSLYR